MCQLELWPGMWILGVDSPKSSVIESRPLVLGLKDGSRFQQLLSPLFDVAEPSPRLREEGRAVNATRTPAAPHDARSLAIEARWRQRFARLFGMPPRGHASSGGPEVGGF